ncbi:MAG: hemolysin family protein [Rhizobiaceae bacterium]
MNSTDPTEPVDSVDEASVPPGKELIVIDNSVAENAPNPFAWFWRLLGRKRGNGASVREGLADALARDTTDSEGFSAEEKAMLASVLRLKDIRVEELMVPRTDIEAVDMDTTLAEMLLIFEAEGHSRLPAYDETLDDPQGMVHIRDVVAYITRASKLTRVAAAKRKTKLPADLDLKRVALGKTIGSLKLVRPILFVPPSMMAMDLMARMQASRTQMALVIDEYGGTDGLVSLEDIMEEIVGDIEDEHDDEEEEMILDRGDGTFVCSAKAELEDVEAATGKAFNAGDIAEDVDTVGGLIIALVGRVPARGEVINALGFEFRVIDADPRRIKAVILTINVRRRRSNT